MTFKDARRKEILKEIFATKDAFGVSDKEYVALLLGAAVHLAEKCHTSKALFLEAAGGAFDE